MGDFAQAAESLTEALDLYRTLGSRHGEATVLGDLGYTQCLAGDNSGGITTMMQTLELYRAIGYRLGEAAYLDCLA